jgi:hypothetical protein
MSELVPSGDVQGLVEALKRLLPWADMAVGRYHHDTKEARAELAKWETASSGEAKDAG